MPNQTLTAMISASALTGAELFYTVQGGADRKATSSQVYQYITTVSTLGSTPAALTLVSDTNVTLTPTGLSSIAVLTPLTVTAAWAGTLSSARLNANVVQTVTNDSNVTGVISSQNLALGWAGTLPSSRIGTVGSSQLTGVIASSQVGLGPFTANQVVYASSATTASGMTGTVWNDANHALTITGVTSGTVTTPVLSINQTWNAGAVFTAFKVNATHTLAGAGSLLFDIQKDTISLLNLDSAGTLTLSNGGGVGSRLVIIGGTDQLANPLIDVSRTWNNGAATFFGFNMNVTNTLSGANSRLVSLTVNTSQVFAIDVNGAVVKGTLPSSQLTGLGVTGNLLYNNAGALTPMTGSSWVDTTRTMNLSSGVIIASSMWFNSAVASYLNAGAGGL